MCRVGYNEHYSVHRYRIKDTSESNIRKWVSFTENMAKLVATGRIGFIPLILNKKYFYQYRNSLSLREACLKFNIPTDSIIKWKRFC
jgi:hypothetical protein